MFIAWNKGGRGTYCSSVFTISCGYFLAEGSKPWLLQLSRWHLIFQYQWLPHPPHDPDHYCDSLSTIKLWKVLALQVLFQVWNINLSVILSLPNLMLKDPAKTFNVDRVSYSNKAKNTSYVYFHGWCGTRALSMHQLLKMIKLCGLNLNNYIFCISFLLLFFAFHFYFWGTHFLKVLRGIMRFHTGMGTYNNMIIFMSQNWKIPKYCYTNFRSKADLFTEFLVFFQQQGKTSKQEKISHGNLVKKSRAINQTPKLCSWN